MTIDRDTAGSKTVAPAAGTTNGAEVGATSTTGKAGHKDPR